MGSSLMASNLFIALKLTKKKKKLFRNLMKKILTTKSEINYQRPHLNECATAEFKL